MLSFLKELTRRKVWLFGGIYLALGWVLLQVAVVVESTLSLPGWVDQIALLLLGLGFPIALLLAWAQESQGGHNVSASVAEAAKLEEPLEAPEERPSFSIAVLPFDDLSQEDDFGAVADGVAEDILTGLSFYNELNVAARNTSFAFKGTSPDIRKVGTDLDVRFVLEGSLRRVGNNVRTTAQLIETLTGDHIWSDQFDRPAESLDTDLDDVVNKIVFEVYSVAGNLEARRLLACDPQTLSVRDLTSLTRHHLSNRNLERLQRAHGFMAEALKKDQSDCVAHAQMAEIEAALPIYGSGKRREHWGRAVEHLLKAKGASVLEMESLIPMAMAASFMSRQSDMEIYCQQMRQIGPKHTGSWGLSSACFNRVGKFEEALEAVETGRALSSVRSPWHVNFLASEAVASIGLGRFAKAEMAMRQHLTVREEENPRRLLVVALAHQGKLAEAREELDALRKFWAGTLTLASAARLLRSLYAAEELTLPQLKGLALAGVESGEQEGPGDA